MKAALRSATCLSIFAFAGSGVAFAQEAAAADAQESAAQTPDITNPNAAAADSSEEKIIVTGSRIRRNNAFNSPDPVSIIDPDLARAQGQFNTSEMLQSSPVASGSAQITSAISSAFVTNGGIGAETVSLRGLGANRTLVLLNGRRAGPAGTRGAIDAFDLNVLPQSIIKNVEILKTGASSVYGSDAVAGVINLITKKTTNGIQLDGFASVPIESGGQQYRINGTWGKDFGNGHILLSVDYNKREELKRRDRDYLDCAEDYTFDRAGNRVDTIDPRTGNPRCNDLLWGHVWLYDSSFRQAGLVQASYPGDNLGTYLNSTALPPGLGAPAGFYRVTFTPRYNAPGAPGDLTFRRTALGLANAYHPKMREEAVIPKTERLTAYLDASYEINDSLEVGTELLYNNRKTQTSGFRQMYYLTGYTSNFGGADPFSPGWTGQYFISPTAFSDHNGARLDLDYYRGVAWANGTFGGKLEGWNYNAYAQFSRSSGTYENDIIYKDSVDLHDYRTSSCAGGLTPVSRRPCVDIDWTKPAFLYGDLTAAERSMLYGVDIGKTTFDQLATELSFSGKVIDLPAGALQLAFGGAYRTDKILDTPGIETRRGNSWGLTSAGITAGKTATWEAFAETEIPLIFNTPLVKSFTISASGRVTNVTATRASDGVSDTVKGNWTYSAGANWEVTDWLRLRGRYGTSFRAPALYEQFLSNQTSFLSQRQVDPCIGWANALAAGTITQRIATNCGAGTGPGGLPGVPGDHTGAGVSATITTGGGLGVLDPETSSALTGSVILTPKFAFLPNTRINIAVDYFDIRIKGEIATLGANSIISGCYNSDFFPTDPLCSLFNRFAGGTSGQFNVQGVTATFININRQRNEGLDLTIDIEQDIGKLGSLQLLAQMNWQFKDEVELFSGTIRDDNGEAGEPKWVGDFNLIWSPNDTTRIFYGLDVIGGTSDLADYIQTVGGECRTASDTGIEFCPLLTAKTTFYHNLSITKKIADGRFEITAGVSNLFDKHPPRVTVAGSNSLNGGTISTVGKSVLASQYDYLGRRAFVAVKAKF
jgi:iron complex outermembrane receptor protein